MTIKTILFDLDGTLFDTAPDLAHALNLMFAKYNKPTLALEHIRPTVSLGSKAMLELGFDLSDKLDFDKLRSEFLQLYQQTICLQTKPFSGVEKIIDFINNNHLKWGIVTNKPCGLTKLLLSHFAFTQSISCVVGGDTVSNPKPHPQPLLHACKLTQSTANQCVYLGDAERDIIAGNRAGMTTLIAKYGYIPESENIENWNANGIIDSLEQLNQWITSHSRSGRR